MGSSGIRILVVDDDADLRSALTEYIGKMGVTVRTAGSLSEAQRQLQLETAPYDLVLTDLKIPGGTGMDVLRAAHLRNPESLVTIITGYASMETAIEAIRLGAYNYITKPFSLNEIGIQVRNMIERITLSKENARLSIRLQELYQQVNRAQSERAELAKMHEELKRYMQESDRKLDQLLAMQTAKPSASQPLTGPSSRFGVGTLAQALGKMDELKTGGVSALELEEKKRHLIEDFISDF